MDHSCALSRMAARRGEVPGLDGLRAVSILLVLFGHFVTTSIPGGLGVLVFFIISGFLITRLLFVERNTTGTISLPLFYIRRVLRLYPVIVVFTVLVLGLTTAFGRHYDLLEPASALGYFANYYYAYIEFHHVPATLPFAIFWSLSIEEHFYLLFPMTFLLLRGDPPRLMYVLVGLCITCLGLRMLIASLYPSGQIAWTLYSESQYRLDSIGFGVMMAVACETGQGCRFLRGLTHPALFLGGLATILGCLLIRDQWFRDTLRYTVLGGAIVVVVSGILFDKKYRWIQQLLNTSLLRWTGRLSYSLYVWHLGVSSFLPLHNLPPWLQSICYIAASFLVASVSYYLIEQPFLALRRYFRSETTDAAKVAVDVAPG